MKHEDAALLLHDFHYGKIDGRERAELKAHLNGCEECRALSETYRLLRASLKQEQRGTEHPTVEEVVAYAVDRASLEPAAAARVAGHLPSCAGCSDELERTRRVHASVRRGSVREIVRRPWFGAAVAAGIGLVAVLVLAATYVGRVERLGDRAAILESEVGELETSLRSARAELSRMQSWGGALALNLLASGLRDEREAQAITVRHDQPYVLLGVELDLAAASLTDADVGFELRDQGGVIRWSQALSAAEVREALDAAGVVTFLIPRDVVPAGSYELRVVQGAAPLLVIPFETLAAS